MGKKKRKEAALQAAKAQAAEAEPLSRRGKRVIAAGVALLILGFCLLTWTDPDGRNWASTLSPIVILGAYSVIGLGILLPEKAESPPPASSRS